MTDLPKIGITMGDPSGIGPEIIIKALSDGRLFDICRPIVLGDKGALSAGIKGYSKPVLNEIGSAEDAKGIPGHMDLIGMSSLEEGDRIPGLPMKEGGRAMVGYITRGVEMCLNNELSGIVTCPINKALMHEAGFKYEGHTQLLAELTKADQFVMMLAGDRLRVTLVTIHRALRDVPGLLSPDAIFKTVFITWKYLKQDFGIENPRIAVTALNPHAGEEGLFGSEEDEIIIPAVERAKKQGISLDGPLPADTLFHKAASGHYDVVVCMYHDQGLIPLKLLHFSDGVNITLGLPIIRTSVDHGTAYDIAGKGVADDSSLKAAIRTAVRMAENRKAIPAHD